MNTSAVISYVNFVGRSLSQGNPIEAFTSWVTQTVYMLATYRSNIKLNKYRQSMYAQQLARMEGYLDEGSPYAYNGRKFNRKY
jgi:hypothetical protein